MVEQVTRDNQENEPTSLLLYPCSGLAELVNGEEIVITPAAHVFRTVVDDQSQVVLGYFSQDQLQDLFPDAKTTNTGSHSLCPPCFKYRMDRLDEADFSL